MEWPTHRIASVLATILLIAIFPVFTGTAFFAFGPVPYFLAAFLVLALVVAFVAKPMVQRIAQTLLGLLAIVFVAGNAEFIFPELRHPEHFPDYGISTIGVAMTVVLVLAAIATWVPMLRRPARAGSLGVALLLLVAGLSLGATAAMVEAKSQPAAGAGSVLLTPDVTLTTTASGDKFSDALAVPIGKIAKISVTNADAATHNFHVDALGIASDLLAGKTTDLWIRTDKTGTYQYYCSLHSAKGADGTWTGMTGQFTVS